MKIEKGTVLLAANSSWYLYNFRRNLIKALLSDGYAVSLLAPEDRFCQKLQKLGAKVFNIEMEPRGINPLKDLSIIYKYFSLLKRIAPKVMVNFTIKPVIYGSVAARILGLPHVNTITGLGSAFIFRPGVRRIVSIMYWCALRKARVVFFQNETDLRYFEETRLIKKETGRLVAGSGVDLERFSPLPMPNRQETVFLMVARLFRDKGIYEFVEAAERVRAERKDVSFRLVGSLDNSGSKFAVTKQELRSWVEKGLIDYRGEVDDVREEMSSADCVVLPSYREGMSKVLMEAAAVARPIIATNVPGCSDAVVDGKNGYLCPPRNGDELRKVIGLFLDLPFEARQKMADVSRDLAANCFGEQAVVSAYLRAISDANLSH